MKKTTLLTVFLALCMAGISQNQLKGRIAEVRYCQIADPGYVVEKTHQPTATFFTLTDKKLIITNPGTRAYNLTEKSIDTANGSPIIHWMTKLSKRKIGMVAVRECEGLLLLAIFPMDGTDNFIEYVLSVKK